MRKPQETPPPQSVHIVHQHAIYTIASLTAALRLRPGSLPREIRKGRLRVHKRVGKYFILGVDVLEWLRSGSTQKKGSPRSHLRQQHNVTANGRAGEN